MNNIFDNLSLSRLGELLSYQPGQPLMFNSGLFLFLFCAFLVVYRIVSRHARARMIFVILFSLYFYYKSSGIYILCLLLVTLSDFFLGRLIGKSTSLKRRKLYVATSAVINIGMLCYFKYTTLIVTTINRFLSAPIGLWDIALPVGISFFTFRSLSYIIDIYRNKMQPTDSLLDYLFFLSFFSISCSHPFCIVAFLLCNKMLYLNSILLLITSSLYAHFFSMLSLVFI